jgi:hypothetical protein
MSIAMQGEECGGCDAGEGDDADDDGEVMMVKMVGR